MVPRILAAVLAFALSLGASLPARACTRRSACCQACERSERGSLRPDCCRLIDTAQHAAANPAREIPVSPPDALPVATFAAVMDPHAIALDLELARVPQQLSTSPPTPLRI